MSNISDEMDYIDSTFPKKQNKDSKLVEDICKIVEFYGVYDSHQGVTRITENGVSEIIALVRQSEWISVDDELPEFDIPVMVIPKGSPEAILTAMRYYDDSSDGWLWGQISGYNCCLNRPDDYVFDDDYCYTHWQPLPSPPDSDK